MLLHGVGISDFVQRNNMDVFLFLLVSPDVLAYVNVLVISFITSIILFIPVPYVPVLIATSFNEKLDPNLIALMSTIGVTSGRSIIFQLVIMAGRC